MNVWYLAFISIEIVLKVSAEIEAQIWDYIFA